jgi:hypothetical protein
MVNTRFWVVIAGAVFTLSSCGFAEDVLWPSLTGEEPSGRPTRSAERQSEREAPRRAAPPVQAAAAGRTVTGTLAQSAQPPLGTTNFQPSGVTSGASTGTAVGKKAEALREDLRQLQASVAQHNAQLQQLRAKMVQDSQGYHGTVAAINARLQVGTTPGNPILVQQLNSARSEIDRLGTDIGEMNRLGTMVSEDSTKSGFMSESARAAFRLSGAVDEDHRQLAILEDEINRTVVLIDRLLKEVAEDVRRQTNYVATERSNLNLLSTGVVSGEIYGASLVNRAMLSRASANGAPLVMAPLDTTGRRPLVIIRFDRANVPFQQALYNAVSRVLERRPEAAFDLVSVAPASGGAARIALNSNKARRHAEGVLRSLIEMGLPPGRVAVSAKTSGTARINEVHLYLR